MRVAVHECVASCSLRRHMQLHALLNCFARVGNHQLEWRRPRLLAAERCDCTCFFRVPCEAF